MPARRPYASRGVPRRATTRRSRGEFSVGPVVLVGLLGVIVAGAVWVASAQSVQRIELSAVTPVTADSSLTMGQVAPPVAGPTSVSEAHPLATEEPTQRKWAARAPGIVSDPALIARLDQALAGVDGHIGVAVKDLGSGRGAVLDGDLELQSASLYKLPVLYTVFAAGLSVSEPLPITDDALSYDAGTMELGPGETLTVAEALERMVTLSDNVSAIMLASRVGGARINASIATLGLDATHYSLERMTTSALDMLHIVELVADGKAVSQSASADMLHLMLRQRVNDRLPRLLPADTQVAHKTGNLPGIVNDVGILYGRSSTVAIAVLVSDAADESAAAMGIARVAFAAHTYFDQEQPESANRPQIPPAPNRPIPPVWREPRPPTPTPLPTQVEPVTAVLEVQPTPTLGVAVVAATPTLPPTAAPAITQQPTARPTDKPTPAPPPPTATAAPPAPTLTPVPPPPTPGPQPPPSTRAPARGTPTTSVPGGR